MAKGKSAGARRLALLTLIALSLCLITAFIFFTCCLDRVITAIYRGESLPVLNRLIYNTDNTPLSYYLTRAHLLFSHLIVLCIVTHLFIAAAISHDYMRSVFINFFTTPTSALNLAVFRIAVMVTLLLDLDPSTTIWFSNLPRGLQFAPFGMGWLLPHLPIFKSLVMVAVILLVVVCITGLVGLFTRTSMLLALILSLYVLGITQFYGKVSHDHHLIWFLAILAVSRSGDSLSLDAILGAIRRADRGELPARPPVSIVYSLPLRFACLLLGIIYFFPGFWKVWTCGFDWALSENIKYQMYSKWMEFNGWTPFFRLDWHPWLYKSSALVTITFETSFVFLILFPRLRALAAAGGVLFHSASALFMRIFFYDLLICYVALFDVGSWLQKLGCWLFPDRLTLFYDENCRFCRRTVAAIVVLDILDRITLVSMLNEAETARVPIFQLDHRAARKDMHAVSGDQTWTGFAAYRALASRVPLLWPIVPLLHWAPIEAVGTKSYRGIADSRTCTLPQRTSQIVYRSESSARGYTSVVIVGILLLAGNVYTGGRRIMSGWPFACYPLFDFIQREQIDSLQVEALDPTGEVIRSSAADLEGKFSGQRFRSLLENLLRMRGPGESADRLKALWKLYVQEDPLLKKATTVRFYRVTLCTIPESQRLNPVKSELVFEMKL
jgi:predicted DCC family thiol-disulfide oxidoreductase YuxK